MQVGDLVKDRHGRVGLIIRYGRNAHHFWVKWCGGKIADAWTSECTVHRRWLKVINAVR